MTGQMIQSQNSLLTPRELQELGDKVYDLDSHPAAVQSVGGMSPNELGRLRDDVDGILDLLQTVLGQTTAGRKALKEHEKQKERNQRLGHVEDVSQRRSTLSHGSQLSRDQ